MRCNHCDRVIEKDESFYEINGEVYMQVLEDL